MEMNKKTDILLSISACFMLFLYAPLELFFTNRGEFWYDIYLLGPVMVICFLIFSVLSILVLKICGKLGEKVWTIAIAAYFIAFLCLYVQGNYMTGNLPPLDGRWIDWSLYSSNRLPSIILWVCVSSVVAGLYKFIGKQKFLKMVTYLSTGLSLMLMVTLITLCVMNNGFEKANSFFCTTKNEFQMSKKKNFIVLILDAVDATYFQEQLNENEIKKDIFADFTFYNNVLGAYPHTKDSIPMILSGIWYENQMEYEDYLKEVYENSPLLTALKDGNYTMGLYEDDSFLVNNCMEQFDNMQKAPYGVTSWGTFARWQIMMMAYRYAPYDLKRFTFVNPNALLQLKIAPENSEIFVADNLDFLEKLTNTEIEYTDQNVFRFIHIEGAHVPFDLDENLNSIENGTYEDDVAASVALTGKYLDKLKKAGVYDDSVIIIMADHGYNVLGVSEDRQNPIFLAKGLNESHEFQTSDAPISFVDLQLAYQRLLDGYPGNAIFDYHSGEERERRYLYYEFPKDEVIIEYTSNGNADDETDLHPTGRKYIYEKSYSNAGVSIMP